MAIEDIISLVRKGHTVRVDSRACGPGDIFFALPGEKTDGHRFVEEAARRGAVCAVVSHDVRAPIACIRVEDTLRALQEVARRLCEGLRVIGITGSCGKTTTKEFLAKMLARKYRVSASEGSQNGQIGLPLSILNGDREADFQVLEMGISQPGEMQRLIAIAPPEIAVITMVGSAHIGAFTSYEALRREKHTIAHSSRLHKLFVGGQGGGITQLMHLPKHVQESARLALSVAEYLGVEEQEAIESVRELVLDKRNMHLEQHGVRWIVDCYNAAPESMRAALETMPEGWARKGAILGEMLELGNFSDALHEKVAETAVEKLDFLLSFGFRGKIYTDRFQARGKPSFWFESKELLKAALCTHIQAGDCVLVKGAHSLKLWELVPCYFG